MLKIQLTEKNTIPNFLMRETTRMGVPHEIFFRNVIVSALAGYLSLLFFFAFNIVIFWAIVVMLSLKVCLHAFCAFMYFKDPTYFISAKLRNRKRVFISEYGIFIDRKKETILP